MMVRPLVVMTLVAISQFMALPKVAAESLEGELRSLLSDFQARYEFPGATAAIARSNGIRRLRSPHIDEVRQPNAGRKRWQDLRCSDGDRAER